MSLWKTIAGVVTAGAGFLTGQPELIGPGLGLIGSSLQESSVNSAAEKQQQATNQALGIQKSVYDQTQARLSPYSDLGIGALGNLRSMLGIAAPPSGPPGVPTNARQSVSTLAPNAYTYDPATGRTNFTGYNPQTGAISGTPPVTLGGGQFSATNPVASQSRSGFVTVRAPNGETAQIDPAHVALALQHGGSIVGGAS